MTYGSICSGIEAATVAWHSLGWHPAFVSEIEAFPCAVLAHHYPEVPNLGDFTSITADSAGHIDLLVGGTPCQSFSVAGKRLGLDDPRGNLAIEFLRLARRLRPRWIVWENVPGVQSSVSHDSPDPCPPPPPVDLGCDGATVETDDEYDTEELHAFHAFLAMLTECGYGWAYRVLDAQYFGIPQRRRRVFVVGCAGGDWRPPAAVLFEPDSLRRDFAPSREAREAVAALTRCGVGTCGADDNQGQAGHLIAHTLRAEGFDASEDGTGRGIPLTAMCLNAHGTRIDGESETFVPVVAGALDKGVPGRGAGNAVGYEDHLIPMAFESRVARNGRGAPDSVVPPLKAQSGETVKGDAAPLVMDATSVRRLTPRECERLQGFPDDYTLIPWRGKEADACPDGPRYRALGNSMAVPVMRWIGERIAMVDDLVGQPARKGTR